MVVSGASERGQKTVSTCCPASTSEALQSKEVLAENRLWAGISRGSWMRQLNVVVALLLIVAAVAVQPAAAKQDSSDAATSDMSMPAGQGQGSPDQAAPAMLDDDQPPTATACQPRRSCPHRPTEPTPSASATPSTLSAADISAIRLNDNGLDLLQSDAPTSPGSCGSPVVTATGKVIGIHSFSEYGSMHFAIATESTNSFLAGAGPLAGSPLGTDAAIGATPSPSPYGGQPEPITVKPADLGCGWNQVEQQRDMRARRLRADRRRSRGWGVPCTECRDRNEWWHVRPDARGAGAAGKRVRAAIKP
jgi:hypothetical protein